ncbi:MAG: hypothetical protein PHI99_10135 [Syntrophales bacterium]|nr:hypothetical protein [Syntrophales bacterium]HPL64752.1 hypothetical protein [Syntrophales bacterium]
MNIMRAFFSGKYLQIPVAGLLFILMSGAFAFVAPAADPGGLIPADACGAEWAMSGKARIFDRENLFEHVNGEAELYMPYGFRSLASALYVSRKNLDDAITADVYEMGSPLDAFGIYSNYRREDHVPAVAGIGAEGFVSPTQLIFYQDKYFVRVQASGSEEVFRDILPECGKALSGKIKEAVGAGRRPAVLAALDVPGISPGSIRYLAHSPLGYDFFRRGLTASAGRDGMLVFLLMEETEKAAREAFVRYRSYLKFPEKGGGRQSLTGIDPLYGKVIVSLSGRFLVGAARITNTEYAEKLTASVLKKLPAQ